MKGTSEGGEIVQVEGGHILRSTGRKDRHSKVYTSKGPRDRRVRLSAHTAIQFYDVQDRLGYDRPSKAVDWLIKKAKTAIDKLNEANPTSNELPLDQFSLIQPIINPGFSMATEPDLNLMKSLFPNDDSASRSSFQAQDLDLSLHSFQESFHGWNMTLPENSQQAALFSHREHLQSNLAVNPWGTNPQPYSSSKTSDLQSPFELGFRVPARIYGDEEPEEHS